MYVKDARDFELDRLHAEIERLRAENEQLRKYAGAMHQQLELEINKRANEQVTISNK